MQKTRPQTIKPKLKISRPNIIPKRKIMSSQNRQKLALTKQSTLVANNRQLSQPNTFEVIKQSYSTTTQQPSSTMNDCDSGCLALDNTTPKCQYCPPLQSSPTNYTTLLQTPAKLIQPSELSISDCLNALRGKVLEVEGNIGCGKSTLTKMIAKILNNHAKGINDDVTVESLSKQDTTTTDILNSTNITKQQQNDYDNEVFALLHGELVNQTFLSSFYADSQRYGFAFQMYMLTTRLYQMQTASFYAKNYGQFQLLDRGAVGDALFALYNASAGNISDEELNIYKSVCADRLPSSLSHKIDIVAFLDVSPLECFRRMNSMRQRDAEKEVVPDYLDGIDQSYFELMVKWLGNRHDACGGINIGLPPPVIIFDWSEFGCAKSVLQKIARAAISHTQQIEYLSQIQHEYNGNEELDQIRSNNNQFNTNLLIRPEVTFIPTINSTTNILSDLSLTTTIDIITTEMQVEELYQQFVQNKQIIGRDGQQVQHLIINWSLPHNNSFRRVVMKHLSREGKVTFFNSDHDQLIM